MGSATLTDAGRADPVLGVFGEPARVLHWHRDAYPLPPGAVRLMPADSLPAHAVSEAESWGGGVLDRLLALG